MSFLNLKAFLSLNASGFQLGMKQAQSQAKVFAREMKAQIANAFGTAAVAAYSAKIINAADELGNLSDRLSVSTKELQEWQYAAKKSGSSADDVTKFFEKLAESRRDALSGNERATESFQRLGVSVLTLSRLRIPEIGKAVGKAFQNGNADELSPYLKDIGGKSASNLIPAFKSGIEELSQAARDAGQVWDEEMVAGIKQAKDQAEALGDTLRGPVATAILYLSRAITNLIDSTQSVVGGAAAYWGAFTMDIDPSKDMTQWDYKAANQRGLKAMDEVQAKYQKLAEERDKLIKENAERLKKQSSANDSGTISYEKFTAIRDLGMRVVGDVSRPEGLTSWQRAGAAVRQEATTPILKNIQTATEKTAERVEALKDLFKNTSNSGSGYGGGF